MWWVAMLPGLCVGGGLIVSFLDHPCFAQQTVVSLGVGFAHAEITPDLESHDVWMAGYAPGRKATSVHDPLYARTVVLHGPEKRIAIVSLDLVGFQLPDVQTIRSELPDYDHVLVTSTHNHQGPDVIGIWGKTPFHGGKDPAYIRKICQRVVETVRMAEKQVRQAVGRFGVADSEALIHDSRKPIVKDAKLRLLQFVDSEDQHNVGMLVQWNCHPEAMGSKNRAITADFPGTTVNVLQKRMQCPIVYISGAVGGLLAPPNEGVTSADGTNLSTGDWAFAERYGQLVADLALTAVKSAVRVRLTPICVSNKQVSIPVVNPWYRAARLTGVVQRPGYRWTGDPYEFGANVRLGDFFRRTAIVTEVNYIRCGEMHLVGLPGELYPELVYGGVPEPAEPGADYPKAAVEPIVMDLVPDRRSMIIGLANDEIGYIIPKRQWDQRSPFAYGRRSSQYGEINSCGPDTARFIMEGLREAVLAMPKEK
jgi:hypothetical protein